jgi:hypothetical protein
VAYVQCRAMSKQSGKRCRRPCGPGAVVCHMHGGKIPQVAAKARERVVAAKARKVLADLGESPDPLGNPLVALEDVARRMIALTEVTGNLVADLKSIRYSASEGGGEQTRAELAAYMRILKDTADVLEKINRLDLDGQLNRIKAAQAGWVLEAVMGALDAAGVEGEKRAAARLEAAKVLRRVTETTSELVT